MSPCLFLAHSPVFITVAVLLSLALFLFSLYHAHGIVHFVAHLPGVEGMIRQVGWDKARAIYWHLRHLMP